MRLAAIALILLTVITFTSGAAVWLTLAAGYAVRSLWRR
jgi:hypothetical protein